VASTRYPPEGIRGVSVSHRANMFGTVPDYFAQSNKNITILVQIESQQGVDNVDAIAATEGVDGIFVGPSDLAAALGHLGNAAHPEVQRAIQHIFASAKSTVSRAAFWRRLKPMRAAIWNGARPSLPSAATWACSVLPRRNWLTPLKITTRMKREKL
jgi:2-dehydro-3-deoxyglucarate aldolase